MKRKWLPLKICICVFLSVILIFTSLIGFLLAKGLGLSVGRYLGADDGKDFLVVDRTPIQMSDRSKKQELFDGLETGDRILVIHTGIEESYPARSGAYFVLRLERGTKEDIPPEVISSLTELGWLKEK